jgi:nitrite reductase (cytochrome c-552)
MMNADKAENPSYLEQYPFLTTIFAGMGFAKSYNEARGHVYALQDVGATERVHETANCLTCKTPAMNALVAADGPGIYSMPFDDLYALVDDSVSCYNCHENSAGETRVTAGYLKDALGTEMADVKPGLLVCGQCHVEYYFDPATKATTLPWNDLAGMTPDAILAYYNAIGFSDFTNTFSGAAMIKIQHPEFETVRGTGSLSITACRATCVGCHTGLATDSEGRGFTSHLWISPLENANLLETRCVSCHVRPENIANLVAGIQAETKGRLVVLGERLADLHVGIGAAAEEGVPKERLAELRSLVRDAQFYYDFVFAENSFGAHNSYMTKDLLDKSEQIIDEASALL